MKKILFNAYFALLVLLPLFVAFMWIIVPRYVSSADDLDVVIGITMLLVGVFFAFVYVDAFNRNFKQSIANEKERNVKKATKATKEKAQARK